MCTNLDRLKYTEFLSLHTEDSSFLAPVATTLWRDGNAHFIMKPFK